jgi:hypothetical protein
MDCILPSRKNNIFFKITVSIVLFVAITFIVYYYHCNLLNEQTEQANEQIQQMTEKFTEFRNTTEYQNEIQKKKEKERAELNEYEITPYSYENPFHNSYINLEEGFTEEFSFPKFPSIEDIGDSIVNALKKPFQPVIDFIDKVKKTFEEIGRRMKLLKKGFDEIGEGIDLEFKNMGKVIKTELDDVGSVTMSAGGLVAGGAKCGWYYITHFRECSIYYFIDLICQIIYSIFIKLPIWLIQSMTGFDLTPMVKEISSWISYVDSIVKDFTGYSMIDFPDSVKQDCYSCSNAVNFNKLMRDLNDDVNKITVDNNVNFPKLMDEPVKKFVQGGTDFKNVFVPM